jgi:23S rRNA (guanosine2251-2'-O)-methyltransferase
MASLKEWIAGRNPVYEVLRASRRKCYRILLASGVEEKGRLAEILSLAKNLHLPVERVQRQRIDSIEESNQGIAMEVGDYPFAELDDIIELAQAKQEPLFCLALDMIQNPQNFGTLLRTAELVGVHGVVIPLRRTSLVTPAVVHSSAGASEHMFIAQANLAQALSELKDAGAWVVGLEGGASAQPIEEIRLDGGLVVVVGSEGEGMRPLVRESCDHIAKLSMTGKIDSMNAAVAGSIALYLAHQARIKAKK